MSTIEISSDSENELLSRRELTCVFRGASGLLTRQGAAEAISTKVSVAKESVQIVSLMGGFGTRDLKATAYIFSDPKDSKRQLSDYMRIRQLPKEERKKAREEKKAKASSASTGSGGKQPPAAKS